MDHVWIDATTGTSDTVVPGALDAPRGDAGRFHVYLVRFQVVNGGGDPVTLVPRLQVGAGEDPATFTTVPAIDPVARNPFYVATDDGRVFRARTLSIAPGALRRQGSSDARATPVAGTSHRGSNPGAAVHLPGHAFTEIEFAVRATADAAWQRTYAFRLVDARDVLPGRPALLTMSAKPAPRLSPGQRSGVQVDAAPMYRLDPGAVLRGATAAATASFQLFGPEAGFPSPHGNYELVTDTCAACHATHTAQSPLLLQQPPPQAAQCFRCHDGTGAVADIRGQYLDPAVPANDAATGSWYAHPATGASNHANDRADEFGGMLNRHAACADCHQPHNASGTLAAQTAAGWTASGALAGAAGVSVANGPAGSAPSYSLNPTSNLEYELCFKCHSGYTTLPPRDPAHPSRWALDKAVELNPANLSYHPVEAPGTNQTPKMAASLAGTSPFKLWAFETTSTIRCVNCHGDSRKATPADPPNPGDRLAPHAVENRGLLMASYRTGEIVAGDAAGALKLSSEAYDAADFALCYQCHAEAPFVDWTGDPQAASNFRFHGYHTSAIAGEGTGGQDIEFDGDGQGNALCAECHYRTHGTTGAVDGQAPNARLVNFSPNIQPFRGEIKWAGGAGGTCTLVCHGRNHNNLGY